MVQALVYILVIRLLELKAHAFRVQHQILVGLTLPHILVFGLCWLLFDFFQDSWLFGCLLDLHNGVGTGGVLLATTLSIGYALDLLVHHQALDFNVLVVCLREKLVLEVSDAKRLVQLILIICSVWTLTDCLGRYVIALTVLVAILRRFGLLVQVEILDAKVINLVLASTISADNRLLEVRLQVLLLLRHLDLVKV